MVDSPSGVIPPDRMLELLRERGEARPTPPVPLRMLSSFPSSVAPYPDERILSLEMSISRLQEHMTGVRDEVHVISKTLYTKVV